MTAPLVSIVTPCLNAERFLDKTIQSVLSQDYPRVEYIVMDGGSSDGTLDVLRRYGTQVKYFSAPDAGVADAVNRGFLKSSGSIFGWLSADDMYFPGAVGKAVEHLETRPAAGAVYGEATWIDEQEGFLGRYPTMAPYQEKILRRECGICQPACFMRRRAFERAGMLNPRLQFSFDYDLWIRLSRFSKMVAVEELLAMSRMHPTNITFRRRREVFEETIALFREHYDYIPMQWIYCYLSYLRDGRDQFFEPLQPSMAVFLASFWTGSHYNRGHLLRYWGEWFWNLLSGKRTQFTPALAAQKWEAQEGLAAARR